MPFSDNRLQGACAPEDIHGSENLALLPHFAGKHEVKGADSIGCEREQSFSGAKIARLIEAGVSVADFATVEEWDALEIFSGYFWGYCRHRLLYQVQWQIELCRVWEIFPVLTLAYAFQLESQHNSKKPEILNEIYPRVPS